ncbi:MAG: phosphonopyruvate decarboxylase [Candidatus Omnitrophica bacterium]|nr:phosphonopyruvate decarboxylase [Candidatus Omnitrophota bacterium]MDD5489040.1 phosphonopyruvate decarboxylase [Candidatus Omnitrophota bacterium]
MDSNKFMDILTGAGFGPFIGVPCSILKAFLGGSQTGKECLIASSEGEAMGIAAGYVLGGKAPVVFMQNSGLGNAVNPLTSLNLIYKLPVLMVITLRGEPGIEDAPQHEIMGARTADLLDVLGVRYEYLPDEADIFRSSVAEAMEGMKRDNMPRVFLVKKGALTSEKRPGPEACRFEMDRKDAIEEICSALDDNCVVVTTTGKITRDYYFSGSKARASFYMMGSMGCASAIGLGLAESDTGGHRIVVIDGDGAVLMKMGNLATIGTRKPEKLVHIVLDNECHETTGGQPTASSGVDLSRVACDCGYRTSVKVTVRRDVAKEVKKALGAPGPAFILIKIRKVTPERDKSGRPSETPEELKNEFMVKFGGGKDVLV